MHVQHAVEIMRADAQLDRLIQVGTVAEQIGNGFGFTEGPIWMPDGCLLFSDIPGNTVYKWTPDGGISQFLKPSGYDGRGATDGTRGGSNGLTIDASGRLTLCEHGNRRVSRLEEDGIRHTLADRFEGKRLNSPNDLVYKSDGSLYFTDPPYGLLKRCDDAEKELPFCGIFRLADGELQLLYDGMHRPNGLALSPDERHLYVSNSDPARKIWMCFEVRSDGSLTDAQLFYDATRVGEPGLPDGIKVDREGNLYCTGPGGIWIFSGDGAHLGTVGFPEVPANCHWGDDDARMLYVTARTGLYRIRFGVPGIRPVATLRTYATSPDNCAMSAPVAH